MGTKEMQYELIRPVCQRVSLTWKQQQHNFQLISSILRAVLLLCKQVSHFTIEGTENVDH